MWQFREPNKKSAPWKNFEPEIAAVMEAAYRKGDLYDDELADSETLEYSEVLQTKEYVIYCANKMTISRYFVEGFICQPVRESSDYDMRRCGRRCVVPREERFLSEEQKADDVMLVEMEKKNVERIRKMKLERMGRDVVALRGSVGFLPNTGVYRWTFQWNHEPVRNGKSDGFGVCSDAKEDFGMSTGAPSLGGVFDKGLSVGLYADGSLYHNGKQIFFVNNVVRKDEIFKADEALNAEKKKEVIKEEDKKNTTENKKVIGNDENYPVKPKKIDEKKQETINSPFAIENTLAALFGKKSLVQCELDTNLNGGTLLFYIDSKKVEGIEITQLFKLLEASEIFPCVCMSPLPLSTNANVADPVVDKKDKKIDKKNTGVEKESKNASVTLLTEEELMQINNVNSGTSITTTVETSPLTTIATTTEDATVVEVVYEINDEVEGNFKEKGSWYKAKISKVCGDNKYDIIYNDGGLKVKDVSCKFIRPTIKLTTNKTEKPKDANSTTKDKTETPIEKVRWMYEGTDGWKVYSSDASRELEESQRGGKLLCTITIGSEVHRCNLETCKQTRGDADGAFKMRRIIMSDGVQGLWEILTMKYESPPMMNGIAAVKLLEKVWSAGETMSGQQCSCGFLSLYSFFSGF
jgi:hypothetical protein